MRFSHDVAQNFQYNSINMEITRSKNQSITIQHYIINSSANAMFKRKSRNMWSINRLTFAWIKSI